MGRDRVPCGKPNTKGLWRMEVSKPGKLVRLAYVGQSRLPSISKTGKRLAYSAGNTTRIFGVWTLRGLGEAT